MSQTDEFDPVKEVDEAFIKVLQDAPETEELARYLVTRLLDLACTTKDHEYAAIAAVQVEAMALRAEREKRHFSPGEWAGHALTISAFLSGSIILVTIALWFAHWALPWLFGQ